MADKNYKLLDRKKILTYLSNKQICSVNDIKAHSGADALRVDPILFELRTENIIKITKKDGWGIPTEVTIV